MGGFLGCGSRKECRKTSERFNHMEADPHNLYPSRADINRARSNVRLGMIEGIGSYLRLSWPTIPHSGSSIERATNRIIPAIAMKAAGSKRAIARRTVSWTSRS